MAAYAPHGKKVEAIELLANGGLSLEEVARRVGVTGRTLRKWRQDPVFAGKVLELSRARIKENLPDIYSILAEKAKTGSHQHIKLVLEHLERMEALKNTAEMGQITFSWKPK